MCLAGVILRKCHNLFTAVTQYENIDNTLCKFESGFDAVRQAGSHFITVHYKTVNNDFYRVLFVFVKLRAFVDIVNGIINAHTDVSVFARILKSLVMCSLFVGDDGSENHEFRAFFERHNIGNDLIDRLRAYDLTAYRAMRHAYTCIQQAEVVVYFGNGADGGTGIS